MPTIPINIATGTLQKNEIVVGIDLGTTNSLVSVVHPDTKKAVVLKDVDELSIVPSIIHFDKNGEIHIGMEAKKHLIEDPKNTLFSVKRLMGKTYKEVAQDLSFFSYSILDDDTDSLVKVKVKDKYYTPIELSSFILKELKKRAEHILKTPVEKVVITVPAYFNDTQRQATKDAGKLAGLDVLRIINEPTAASIAYGIENQSSEPINVVVYDLGGGTFDVSILYIHDGIYEVLSTHGDTFLGGDDIDRNILKYWLANTLGDIKNYNNSQLQTLRLLAEEAKIFLTSKEIFESNFEDKKLSLSKQELKTLIQPLFEKTLQSCKQALKDAKLETKDINHIVLVGGSTRIPFIKNKLESFFNQKPYDKINPDEVVAMGAAIQADILAGNQKDILLLDLIPLSLGIETMGGLMDVLIPRNTKIPFKATRQYSTQKDGQTGIVISVFQGERDLVKDNRKLGEFTLKGIPAMPAGLPKVEITFQVDADSILTVTAKELRSGIEQKIEVKPQYGLTDEDIEKILLDSLTHAQDDIQKRAIIDAKNEGQQLLQETEKFIEKNRSLLSQNEIQQTALAMQNLQLSLTMNDKDLIYNKIEELNKISEPYAHRIMDKAIAESLKGKNIK